MIKRIIFLTEDNFNMRDHQRFGVEILRENRFNVEIWDTTTALHPDLHRASYDSDKTGDKGLISFRNAAELRKKLAALKNGDFVVNLINYRLKTLSIYRALSRSNAEYAVLMTNNLPAPAAVKPASQRTRVKEIFSLSRKEIMVKIFDKTPFGLFGVKAAKLILAGGEVLAPSRYPVARGTEILRAHAMDYDIYMKEKDMPFSGDGNIAVYLDEYLPFHPDWKYYGMEFPMNADVYYGLLDKLFSKIEKELKMEVVIAAHPRSNYKEGDDYFKGRRCARDRSCALVRESRLVISHASTSITFAVLFHKPLLFVTARQIDKCWEGPLIRSIAQWFEKEPIFMDDDATLDWQREMRVNREHYDNYRRNYIKRDSSPELPFWQIVADRLKDPR